MAPGRSARLKGGLTDPSHGRLTRAAVEFVTIVVGVLVALAVDQMAQNRADRSLETEYLRALAEDLRADSSTYDSLMLPHLVTAAASLDEVGGVIRDAGASPVDTASVLQALVLGSAYVTQFETRRSTFDELLATGRLQLVRSADVRSRVLRYYDRLRLATSLSESRASGFDELVSGYLPFEFDEATEIGRRPEDLSQAALVLRSEELLPALNRHARLIRFQIAQVEVLRDQNDALLEVIGRRG